jgi:hypothetical protein
VGKSAAIVQSSYIPWKGYFDLINMADEFVLYDHVQFTKRDWRNRNRIKTSRGLRWLTIPVQTKGRYRQRILDTRVEGHGWARKHWTTILHSYGKAPYFENYASRFEQLFLECRDRSLSAINHRFLAPICDILGIRTRITWSSSYELADEPSDCLALICEQVGASQYITGPSARSYLDERLFEKKGIEVRWMDYDGYPEYPQLHGSFEHRVSIVDLIFHTGPDASSYMKSF